MAISKDITAYNKKLSAGHKRIADALAKVIDAELAKAKGEVEVENKVWHAHPVWFIDGNPIVGYSTLKNPPCVRLLFWSGQSFDEPGLAPAPPDTKFKSADVRYASVDEVLAPAAQKTLKRWLKKSIAIQWDYKNIVKRKGKLVRLK
ncbi:MAG TPA: hypothetical protein VG711_01105 [Phycisphaerales bacterium]|nr:hypothetical protein [Phycisphaerales bacterium]